MSDEEIIGALVKGRERCRQLAQFYQNCRAVPESRLHTAKIPLGKAAFIAGQMLNSIRRVPGKPARCVRSPELRCDAAALLTEISDLLERVLVAEREFRRVFPVEAPLRPSARTEEWRVAV